MSSPSPGRKKWQEKDGSKRRENNRSECNRKRKRTRSMSAQPATDVRESDRIQKQFRWTPATEKTKKKPQDERSGQGPCEVCEKVDRKRSK